MAIISFDKDSVIDYIPEYNGNRESDDPCVVTLRFVPFSKVQEYSRLLSARTRAASDPIKLAEAAQQVQRRQFVENVETVQGYYIGMRKITDPGEFYDTADTDLVLEVIKAMESMARLNESQRKN